MRLLYTGIYFIVSVWKCVPAPFNRGPESGFFYILFKKFCWAIRAKDRSTTVVHVRKYVRFL